MTQTATTSNDALLKAHNLTTEEYRLIKNLIGREPNINELGMFSVMWSEHCSYKHSKHLLKKFPTHSQSVVLGPGENAGVIKLTEDIFIAFKIESHNHPTAIEPFQGATTGVGGILRDIFTMGARPVANLNSLRFGNLSEPHNKYLFTKAVEGIAHYGNCVGVPTIAGECYFDDTYNGNPLVNAMAIGVLYKNDLVQSGATGIDNPVIYVGSSTGRDGMGGAAFASRSLDGKNNDDRPAVQVGDPFQEKLLIEACLEAFKTGYIVAAQDMGAAGLTCSTCEMASKGNVGITIDLDKVPVREHDLTPYEYLLSESQERMLLVVQAGYEQPIIDIFKRWGLHATMIGRINNTEKVSIFHKNALVVDLPAKSLTDHAPLYEQDISLNTIEETTPLDLNQIPDISEKNIQDTLIKLLSSPNIACKKHVFTQFDRQVQNATLKSSSHHGPGIIRIRDHHGNFIDKAIAATVDCNSRYVYVDPYQGSKIAVYEAALNLACTGARPIAITNNLNFGSPENPTIYNQLKQATNGISDACTYLNTPVTGGNVSLYNESHGQSIYPTPVIGMIGIIDNINTIIPQHFTVEESHILLIGTSNSTLDSSEYLKINFNQIGNSIPTLDDAEIKNIIDCLYQLIGDQLIDCAHDVAEGGLLTCISESAIVGNIGCTLNFDITHLANRIDASLFGEFNKRVIITVQPDQLSQTVEILDKFHLNYRLIGRTTGKDLCIQNTQITINLDDLREIWTTSIDKLLQTP